LDHGRVAARTLGSFHPFWSTKIVSEIVKTESSVELSVELSGALVSADLSVELSVRYSLFVNSSLNRFIKFTTDIQIVKNYRVGNCIVLNCVEVANKIRYIPKRTPVMASSRDIEVKEYEEIVGHPDSSPVLRRSSSAESVNDVSPFQEPIMEVEEEFAPTSRPTLIILRTRASRANSSAAYGAGSDTLNEVKACEKMCQFLGHAV